MARRTVLARRQRSALFFLLERETQLLRHYTLSDEDLENIDARRRPRNKRGFALQLCVLRYPGRLLALGDPVRENLREALWKSGTSLAIARNKAYLQQYLARGMPRVLSFQDTETLAELLGCPAKIRA